MRELNKEIEIAIEIKVLGQKMAAESGAYVLAYNEFLEENTFKVLRKHDS